MRAGLVMGAALAACVGASCSTESAPDTTTVVGDWLFVRHDGARALALTLGADGSFGVDFIDLTSAPRWDQVTRGTYDQTTTELTLVPHQETCAQSFRVVVWPYSVSQDHLSVMNGDEPLTLMRNVDPSITQGVTFACLVDETFMPSPLMSNDGSI